MHRLQTLQASQAFLHPAGASLIFSAPHALPPQHCGHFQPVSPILRGPSLVSNPRHPAWGPQCCSHSQTRIREAFRDQASDGVGARGRSPQGGAPHSYHTSRSPLPAPSPVAAFLPLNPECFCRGPALRARQEISGGPGRAKSGTGRTRGQTARFRVPGFPANSSLPNQVSPL